MLSSDSESQEPYFPSGSIFTGSRIAPDGKETVSCIRLPYSYRNELEALSDPVETFRQQRKLAIKEREMWAAHKKLGKDYEPKFAKKNEKFYLQCERACTLMIGYYQTDGHYDIWPVELAPALEYVISAVVCGIWSSRDIDIVLEIV